MKGFNAYHYEASRSAKMGNFDGSLSLAKESLELYPNNLCLILELIKKFEFSNPNYSQILELDHLLTRILEIIGEDQSVFHMSDRISFLRARILRLLQKKENYQFPSEEISSSITSAVLHKSQPFRMGILSCIWKRPELTDIFLSHLQNLSDEICGQVELIPIIIGSEIKDDESICNGYKLHYEYCQNNPVSQKWEYGLKVASRMNLDGLMILGSDDFIDANLILAYASMLLAGVNVVGLPQAYFFDINCAPPKLIFWNGYGSSTKCLGQPHRLGETIGMGRVYSRKLLEEINYSLWHGIEIDRGLDKHANRRLIAHGHLPVYWHHYSRMLLGSSANVLGQACIDLNQINAFAVDIKWGFSNITSLEKYTECACTHRVVSNPWRLIQEKLGIKTADRLQKLAAS